MNMYFLNNIGAWQNKKAEPDLIDYVSTKYFKQTKCLHINGEHF